MKHVNLILFELFRLLKIFIYTLINYRYEPDYLLDEDIVLVTINYRLGMFGFMSTESNEVPGNYGMLDQVVFCEMLP